MLDIIKNYSDVIIMACSLVFAIALLPQVLYNYHNKMSAIPYSASIPTATCLGVLALVYAANGFTMSVVVGSATTIMWCTIALQRYLYDTK
jgi:hypothetical protein